MAAAFRAGWTNSTPSTTLALATSTVAHDFLVLYTIADASTCSITYPSGFTSVAALSSTFDGQVLNVGTLPDATGSEGTLTPTTQQAVIGGVLAFSGVNNTTPKDVAVVTASGTAAGTPWTVSASITPTTSGCVIVAIVADDISSGADVSHSIATTSGTTGTWTTQQDINSGFMNGAAFTCVQSSAGAITVTVTGTSTGATAGAQLTLMALRPAGATGSTASSSGSSTVTATGSSLGKGAGSAPSTSTALAVSNALSNNGAGSASGTSVSAAVGRALFSGIGAASGTSTSAATSSASGTKNIVSKTWSLAASFDGLMYSAYPAGDKPTGYVSVPTLINTDIISGSLTGGEFNKGAYLSLFGYNLGRQSLLGTTSGSRVFMRDPLGDNLWHEVDNYRALISSKVFSYLQVQQIIVQVGALGGAITSGRALDIKVTTNGVDTNILAGQFTVQPGRFWYVDPASGSDATGRVNDITKPFRYVQYCSVGGRAFSGIWASSSDTTVGTTASGDTGLRPGDTIVMRAGTYSDQTGFDGKFCRFRLPIHNGTPPNGVSGNGYFHFVRYPGAVLSHTPEVVYYKDPAGGAGGFHGPNGAYEGTTGQYVSISGLKMELSATTASDGAGVNMQNGGNFWRVFDNEFGPWPSTTAAPNNAKAGGITGAGNGLVAQFNHIHDITGTSGENHGIYLGSSGNGICAKNFNVSYNVIRNITDGSGFQINDTYGGVSTFDNCNVHHNWIETVNKFGINLFTSITSGSIYNNIIINAGVNSIRFDSITSTTLINITHNTCVQTRSNGSYQVMIANTGGTLTGAGVVNIAHNIFALTSDHYGSLNSFTSFPGTDTIFHFYKNLWFDFAGAVSAVPSNDATGIYGNPKFTNASASNYTIQAGGTGLGACTDVEPLAITTDFYGVARPVTNTATPGTTKNDIGATQGVGT